MRYVRTVTSRSGIRVNGKLKEEALGWESEGCTERKALERLSELKENNRIGTGAKTLAEKRELSMAARTTV
ncbi:MAG: hypothetical protein LBR78_02870 [Holosporales bacterium]|jgi:hypothetical protein|nr:hypothetical protein [Holosporales bacterium]